MIYLATYGFIATQMVDCYFDHAYLIAKGESVLPPALYVIGQFSIIGFFVAHGFLLKPDVGKS